MALADAFSPDYFTARRRFREAAKRAGARLEEHSIAVRGPGGETLTVDVGLLGGDRPRRTIVLSSGVHGVEGFLGSAVQLAALETPGLLDALSRGAPTSDLRLVLLHAVNPYGFAFRRRWNEDNVDVNRNLLRDGEQYAGSPPLYARLDGLVNPKSPPRKFDLFLIGAAAALLRYGRRSLTETLPVGQHDFPQGLFYAGAGPTESNRILAEQFENWIGPAADVVHIDFHTGLGKHGEYELYLPDIAGSPHARWFEEHFDADAVSAIPVQTDGGAMPAGYPTTGSFDKWCTGRFADRDYKFATAEFGTYPPVAVVTALRAENRAHHWGAPGGDYEWTKQRLVEAFAPTGRAWRERVVASGVRIVEQCLAAMQTAT